MVLQILIRVLINAIAIAVTAWLLPGIVIINDRLGTYLVLAVVFGLLNTFVRPFILVLTGRWIISTMGIFLLIVNGLMLGLASWIFPSYIQVNGIVPAILGGAIMALISVFLETIMGLAKPIGSEDATHSSHFYGLDRFFHGSRNRLVENLRIQQVYSVFMRYGLDIAFESGPLADFRRNMQDRLHRMAGTPRDLSTPEKVRLMLQELGPIYVKMGQIVSSQAQALPPEWRDELQKLQSNVPPFPTDQAYDVVIEEHGASPDELFAEFSPTPFAAAPTAQVHRARMHDGSDVVVKIQRPNIVTQVKADLGIMQDVSQTLMKRTTWAKEYDLAGMVSEYGAHVMEELDYQNEAYNGVLFAHNMAVYPNVHIPVVYPRLTKTRVLTMEYVEGVKVTDTAAIDASRLDRSALADAFVRSVVKSMLIDGFFHGDPHPGNVLVDLETGQIQFIDLGMMGTLDTSQRLHLGELMMALHTGNLSELGKTIIGLSTTFKEFDEESFLNDLDRAVGRYQVFADDSNTMANVFGVTLDVMHQHGLRLDKHLVVALKTLIQAEQAAFTLDPNLMMISVAFAEARDQLIQQINYANVKEIVLREATRSTREVVNRIPTLHEATMKWLDQYESGRFTLHVDTSDLGKQVKELGVGARYLAVGLILAGMLISVSIVVLYAGAELSGFWDDVMVLLFIAAILLSAGLVFAILRRIWSAPEQ